ncbi:MAG: TRAM domain-containing protein, partial [Candidatus Delongbacteria bacterium]|nr:TRAM domain-containing protein [Candidatus Delongbacteria bacterium]
ETMAEYPNVCNYIDFPIQHTQTRILKAMRRGDTAGKIFSKVNMMRSVIPDIVVRTSIITGFPGETRKIFNNMKANLKELSFDRLGVFPYSVEEGTKASLMGGQVGFTTAKKRADEIMSIQQEISLEKNTALVGKTMRVLIDRIEGEYSIGRTYRDAPDVDNEVLIKQKLNIGEFYNIKITEAEEFDLYGLYLTDNILPS